jgi:hypothetical protein
VVQAFMDCVREVAKPMAKPTRPPFEMAGN